MVKVYNKIELRNCTSIGDTQCLLYIATNDAIPHVLDLNLGFY